MLRCLLALLLIAMPCGQAFAHSSMDPASERALLRAQQQEIESLHTQRLAECAKRFEVNKCREASAAERRARLAPIIERERNLDDEARANRARTQSLRSAARQVEGPASAPVGRVAKAGGQGGASKPAESRAERQARKAAQQQKDEEQAAERVRKTRERQAALDAHAKAVQERNARRIDKPAASLPIPTAASIAALPAASAASRR